MLETLQGLGRSGHREGVLGCCKAVWSRCGWCAVDGRQAREAAVTRHTAGV